ncbi:MAG: phosphoribosylaminoimidazolesuccinocarboxamide synthase [Candidatus Nanoarchaeia archaeon]|nr:phosphoribosylaminoimidazolesuccinocarboxamide synthase [Candidatus Nanoarchaeia archaeon]MDD5239689.1 phosphoribosylaminoimidazolesuccinocarboxamide synthase [Candidatus Nanoarchaeia archaeon]
MGSSKDLWLIKKPEGNETGIGIFTLTDDFSVFDYGKMGKGIPGKGHALWLMSTYNFEHAGCVDAKTHYITKDFPNKIAFRAANVFTEHKDSELSPGFVYDIPNNSTFVIPLEIIYRNELGKESSIIKMYDRKEITPQDVGLEAIAENGVLPHPIITYTTKFEPGDRFLKREEAMRLSGLSKENFDKAEQVALKLNDLLNERTRQIAGAYNINLTHPDGKCELVYVPNEGIIVGDVFGTLDEDRFKIVLDDGVEMKLSKQILRDWYKKTEWYNKFEAWKEIRGKVERGELSVKKLPNAPKPPAAPKELIAYASSAYLTFASMWSSNESHERSLFETLETKFRKLKSEGLL